MRKKIFLRAQSTTEYAIILAVVAAALVAMQIYVKRGIQGRIRDLADQISPTHYEQTQTDSVYTTTQEGTLVQQYVSGITRVYQDPTADLDGDGTPDAPAAVPETVTRSGYEEVIPETEEIVGGGP